MKTSEVNSGKIEARYINSMYPKLPAMQDTERNNRRRKEVRQTSFAGLVLKKCRTVTQQGGVLSCKTRRMENLIAVCGIVPQTAFYILSESPQRGKMDLYHIWR